MNKKERATGQFAEPLMFPNQLPDFVISSCHLDRHLFNNFLKINSQFLLK